MVGKCLYLIRVISVNCDVYPNIVFLFAKALIHISIVEWVANMYTYRNTGCMYIATSKLLIKVELNQRSIYSSIDSTEPILGIRLFQYLRMFQS
jgi:hypothetical protein